MTDDEDDEENEKGEVIPYHITKARCDAWGISSSIAMPRGSFLDSAHIVDSESSGREDDQSL